MPVQTSVPPVDVESPTSETLLLFLTPDEILDDTNQVREYDSGEDFEELVQSVAEQGVLQPLLVEELPASAPGQNQNQSGSYLILAGHRRLAAARRLELKTVPCLVKSNQSGSPNNNGNGNSSTNFAFADYNRLISQVAENRVRSDTDPYDEAVAIRTAKVLADIQRAKEHLIKLEALVELSLPDDSYLRFDPAEPCTNRQRLNLYEAYLAELTTLLTGPQVAPHLPKDVAYETESGYKLTDQALAPWSRLEKACGLSKSSRIALMRLLQVQPEVVTLVRENAPKPLTTWSVRPRLQALAAIHPLYQQRVVEALLAQPSPAGKQLEPKVLEGIGEALSRLEEASHAASSNSPTAFTPDIVALVELALAHPKANAPELLKHYYQHRPEAAAAAVGMVEDAPASSASAEDNSNPVNAGDNSDPFNNSYRETSFEGSAGESNTPAMNGQAHASNPNNGGGYGSGSYSNTGGSYGGSGGSYGGNGGFGGRGGGGSGEADDFTDLDSAEGFELTGLPPELDLPPDLAEELDALNLSDAAIRAIATLDDLQDQRRLVEMLRQYPHLAGKLRRIVGLVRDEGWPLSEALDEALGWVNGQPVDPGAGAGESGAGAGSMSAAGNGAAPADNRSREELLLEGMQSLMEAVNSLGESLELLRAASDDGLVTGLVDPWAAYTLDELKRALELMQTAGFRA
ncbi:MAG TPA: ParB N-terminal domain-containing protein [Chloroflexia bacterium]|nr:ParB N-terminal domain-containing protein [Chloroflexia bacterium]